MKRKIRFSPLLQSIFNIKTRKILGGLENQIYLYIYGIIIYVIFCTFVHPF